ncbi:plasmid mobilization relaxosome protein MobC (plasmid) [Rhizobium sp. T1470]|uniref:plasmid mobilization protein n=1 Tax=unclassified Rhizobium TaxID=2613769 RepID=UPI00296F0C25|nr:plasmid mobilization relaxosome protein MobC [Rhizobium sp. T1473]
MLTIDGQAVDGACGDCFEEDEMAASQRKVIESGAADKRKDRVVHARFSTSEIAVIARVAAGAGMTISAFMRSLTLEGAGVRPFFTDDDRAILDLLLSDMRAIGVNLNQLARAANSSGHVDAKAISAQTADIQKIVAAVMLELRRFAARGAQRRRGTA